MWHLTYDLVGASTVRQVYPKNRVSTVAHSYLTSRAVYVDDDAFPCVRAFGSLNVSSNVLIIALIHRR